MTTQKWKTSLISSNPNNISAYLYTVPWSDQETETSGIDYYLNNSENGYVGNNGYESKRRILLKFDFSDVPFASTSQIISATLYLIYSGDSYETPVLQRAYKLTNDWNNNSDPYVVFSNVNTDMINSDVAWGTPNPNLQLNILQLVKDWINGTTQNYGVVVADKYSEDNNHYKYYGYGLLNTNSDSIKPYIEIEYNVPPATPTGFNATSVNSHTISCSWTDTSNDETGFKVFNQLGVSPNPSTDTLMFSTTSGTSVNLSGFTEGVIYKLYVVAYNSNGNSNPSNVVTVSPTYNLSNTLEIKYDINQEVSNSLNINYDIRQEVSNSLEIVYNLNKETVTNSLEFKYDIYGSEKFTLGKYKLGEKPLAFRVNTDFFDLVETITLTKVAQAKVFNMIEGIVVYRKSTKNTTEYFNAIYAIGQKHLTETITIKTSTQYNLSESILVRAENKKDLTESINLFLQDKSDLTENLSVYRFGTFDKNETLTVVGQQLRNLNESINVVYGGNKDLNENLSVYYLSLRNLDETFTIRGQKYNYLNEKINVVFDGRKNLTETITIISNYKSLVETISIKSLALQNILLYEDAQHNILIPNDTQSFIYSFPDCIEEDRIVPFYIVSNKNRPISNLYVEISLNQPKTDYGADMVYLSKNGTDWTTGAILLDTLLPLEGGVFYCKLSPLLGVDNKNHNLTFRIYKK